MSLVFKVEKKVKIRGLLTLEEREKEKVLSSSLSREDVFLLERS